MLAKSIIFINRYIDNQSTAWRAGFLCCCGCVYFTTNYLLFVYPKSVHLKLAAQQQAVLSKKYYAQISHHLRIKTWIRALKNKHAYLSTANMQKKTLSEFLKSITIEFHHQKLQLISLFFAPAKSKLTNKKSHQLMMQSIQLVCSGDFFQLMHLLHFLQHTKFLVFVQKLLIHKQNKPRITTGFLGDAKLSISLQLFALQ